MARPKGNGAAKPAAIAPQAQAQLATVGQQIQVSRDEFIRTRDAVVAGLKTLQRAVRDLSFAYVMHTNNVLTSNSPGSALDLLSTSLADFGAPIEMGMAPAPLAVAAAPPAPVEETKKRKKIRDPNEPKRPLTAFFLYMQKARPIIANDLGETAAPKDVSEEGTRRWNALPEEDKAQWRAAYDRNREIYKKELAAYKATLPAGGAAVDGDAAAAQLSGEAAAITAAPVAVVAASGPPKKKRKSTKATPAAAPEEPAPAAVPAAAPATPAAKKEKKTKKATPAAATPAAAAETAKDKRSKKKAEPKEKAAAPEKKKRGRAKKDDAAAEATA